MVRVTDRTTGEVFDFKDASLMVASSGTIFIKDKKGKTIFASSSGDIVAVAM